MGKIHKLTKEKQTIYPATITDAVVHPDLKVSTSKLIEEINVSKLFPTGGIDGSNKYTLETAIAKIPKSLQTVGIKCSFLGEDGKLEAWVYRGGGGITYTDNWIVDGAFLLESSLWDNTYPPTGTTMQHNIRKALIECYIDKEFDPEYSYSLSIIDWSDSEYAYINIYKKPRGVTATSENIQLFETLYGKIEEGKPFTLLKPAADSNSYIVFNFSVLTDDDKRIMNLYDYDGVALNPAVFKGMQQSQLISLGGALGLTDSQSVELSVKADGKCVNSSGALADNSAYRIYNPITVPDGKFLVGYMCAAYFCASVSKDNGDDTYIPVIKGANNSPYIVDVLLRGDGSEFTISCISNTAHFYIVDAVVLKNISSKLSQLTEQSNSHAENIDMITNQISEQSDQIVDDSASIKTLDYFATIDASKNDNFTPIYTSSTFSGFGFNIGEVDGAFKYLWTKLKVSDWLEDSASVTQVLVQIKQTDRDGDLLFSKLLNILPIRPGMTRNLVLDLGEELTLSGSLFLIIRFNSYANMLQNSQSTNPNETVNGVYFTGGNLNESSAGNLASLYNELFFKLYLRLSLSAQLPDTQIDNISKRLVLPNESITYDNLNHNKFVKRGAISDAYEEGLLDIYVDKSLWGAISYLDMWCYGGNLYVRYKEDTEDLNYIIQGLGFKNIENDIPVPITKDNVQVGYIVFCDKQKFIDNSTVTGYVINMNYLTSIHFHPYLWVYRNLKNQIDGINSLSLMQLNGINSELESVTNNVCDPETLTKGSFYVNYETGVTGTGFGYGYTDYIPIDKHGLTITNGYVFGEVIGHAVYNARKQYIRGYRSNTIDYQDGDAYVRFSIGSDIEHVMVSKGKTALSYVPYEGVKKVISEESLPKSVVDPAKTFEPIEISLPDKIYAVVGDTLQLFYRGMIQAVDPYRYNILVSCSKGKQYPRYFEYLPTAEDVGTVNFTITVKDDNRNVLFMKTCQLVTVDIVKSPTSNLKVMCFGDSLTSAGTWCREADRRLTEAGGTPAGKELTNIDFVGSKKNGNTGYFGVGGWTWNSYTQQGRPAYRFQVSGVTSLTVGAVYTNNGNTFTIMEVNVTEGTGNILCSVSNLSPAPEDSGVLTKSTGNGDATITYSSVAEDTQNPLWDNEEDKMSFIPYANKVSGGQVDVVYTLLTWNGHTAGRTDFSSMLTQMKIFADTLHEEFPNAKLKILGVQVPSVRGGMGANYGATGASYADGYGMVVTALNMNKFYQEFANDEEYSSFVEFVNISSQFDTEYNMPHSEKAVNTRNTDTEWIDTNGVHPSNNGYYQIGDVVYRNFIANFCQ